MEEETKINQEKQAQLTLDEKIEQICKEFPEVESESRLSLFKKNEETGVREYTCGQCYEDKRVILKDIAYVDTGDYRVVAIQEYAIETFGISEKQEQVISCIHFFCQKKASGKILQDLPYTIPGLFEPTSILFDHKQSYNLFGSAWRSIKAGVSNYFGYDTIRLVSEGTNQFALIREHYSKAKPAITIRMKLEPDVRSDFGIISSDGPDEAEIEKYAYGLEAERLYDRVYKNRPEVADEPVV